MSQPILFITRSGAAAVGGGGPHRAYQIEHDLKKMDIGPIETLSLPEWRLRQPLRLRRWWHWKRKLGFDAIRQRFSLENPYRAVAKTQFSIRHFAPQAFFQAYTTRLKNGFRPKVVVIDDSRLANIITINRRYHIPTILCSHNIESLDTAHYGSTKLGSSSALAHDFANELRVFSQADACLFISKVETGLVGGLGLPSHFYPYRPVGEVRRHLRHVAQMRQNHPPAERLFLMLGSAQHETTGAGMRWFIEQARRGGLPENVQIVVGGTKTEQLSNLGLPNVSCRGWLSVEELTQLLMKARAVLIPQQSGFGALTRLPELACANIPAIVSRHPTHALDLTPNLFIADPSWDSWQQQIAYLAETQPQILSGNYVDWEARQAKPLASIVQQFVEPNPNLAP